MRSFMRRETVVRHCASSSDSDDRSSGEKRTPHFERVWGGTDAGQYLHEDDRVDRISRCDISCIRGEKTISESRGKWGRY